MWMAKDGNKKHKCMIDIMVPSEEKNGEMPGIGRIEERQ